MKYEHYEFEAETQGEAETLRTLFHTFQRGSWDGRTWRLENEPM